MGLLNYLRSLFDGSPTNAKHAAWDDPVDLAALVVPEIASGQKPTLLAIHDLGLGDGLGGWTFLDGEDIAGRPPIAVAKVDLLRIDPTLAEVTDLPIGWQARRAAPGKPWIRERS